MAKSKTIVWGAGGFVGAELLRLIVGHPYLELAAALSSTHADRRIAEVHPSLAGWTDLSFQSESDWNWELCRHRNWTLFAALPHRTTMHKLPSILTRLENAEDFTVVDLSGDFRLDNPEVYCEFYGENHVAPQLLERFVYGLPELNRERIRASRWIANPGCFATGAQLALLPLATSGERVEFAALDGKTGSSGAGIQPLPSTHHPQRSNNFRAYRVVRHQHLPEIAAAWRAAGGCHDLGLSFVPQMAPMVRGIFTTAHIWLSAAISPGRLEKHYQDFYRLAPMVRLVEDSPAVAEVWGSNRCDLSIHTRGRCVVVCTAIDNLIKGAAGQAIQNANLAQGWDESAGLRIPAPWPV